MGPDPHCKVDGCHALELVSLDVLPDLPIDGRQVEEIALELRRHPDPRQILVPLPVAKPAAHLHERVVGTCGSSEETDDDALQRQATRQCVSTDDDLDGGFVFRVLKPDLTLVILHDDRCLFHNLLEMREQSAELDRYLSEIPG